MNNKLKAVLFLLILLIPSYLAVASYIIAQNKPVETKTVEKVKITDTAGKSFLYTKEEETGAAEIAYLTALNSNAKAADALPEPLTDTPYFKISYYSYDMESVYKYYISKNPAEAYYINPSNQVFKIAETDAASFVCKDFAQSLYAGSAAPSLKLSEETVVPKSFEWKYKLADGTYRNLETKTTEDSITYRMDAKLSLNFDIQPDLLAVTITENGETLYTGDYSDIANLTLTESKVLSYHIEAKWYEMDGKEGQGSAIYDFDAKVNAPASFYLTRISETIEPGDFVLITAKDVAEDSSITFTSAPEIGFTPKFVKDGDYYRAFVPFSYELEGGEYVFTLSSDGVTQTMNVTVTPKTFKARDYTVDAAIVSATRTEETLKEFSDTMQSYADSCEVSGALFAGTFSEGVPNSNSLLLGFGIYRTINGGETYRHQGVDYTVPEGTDITAVNDGKVIYVGETTLSGKMVVVEHGLGLKSWYCHLSETKVNVGDTVKKGDLLGLSGSTGFTAAAGAHIGLSVYDMPVSPYKVWDNAIDLPTP